jgi:hypothetical protein
MGIQERIHEHTAFPATVLVAAAVGFGVEYFADNGLVATLAAVVAGIGTIGLHEATRPERESQRFFTSGGQRIIR